MSDFTVRSNGKFYCNDCDAGDVTLEHNCVEYLKEQIEQLQSENTAFKEGFQLAADSTGYIGDWFASGPIVALINDKEQLQAENSDVDTDQSRTLLLDRIKGLIKLLAIAKCPNSECIDGAIPHGPNPDGSWEAEQCQFCSERNESIGKT